MKMMHNLEGILFEEVTNGSGVSYAEYRKTLRPNYHVTWLYIIGGMLGIAGFCIAAWYLQLGYPHWFWLSIPLFSILTGFGIAFVSLFIHEAGHFYLHPDKKTNDKLANIVLGSWLGLDIKAYRKIHWQHHLHLATADDTENSYHNPINFSFIIETLSGIHLLRVITNKNNKEFLGKDLSKRSFYMLLTGLLINLVILSVCIYDFHWQFALTWILAMIIFFPFFATIRQIIEHRDELALHEKSFYKTTRGRISRLFSNSITSCLFGPAGFNKHMIHHWDPHLPFTALGSVEKFLQQCSRTREIVESSRTTYFSVLKKMLFTR